MIRPTDETPEQRRQAMREDLEAEVQAKIAAMTEAEIHDGLKLAIVLLAHQGNQQAMLAVMAACQVVADLKERVRVLEEDAEYSHWNAVEAAEKSDL